VALFCDLLSSTLAMCYQPLGPVRGGPGGPGERSPGRWRLHYHLRLIDDEGEHVYRPDTFATQHEAEREAYAVTFERQPSGWSPTRYPGRACRPHEIAVFLDRRDPGTRQHPYLELVVVRCEVDGEERAPGCYFHGRREQPDS